MKRILVIDDALQIRELLKTVLELEGYDVTITKDGDEGVEAFRKNPADLIITDMIMPTKEGLEIIQELVDEYKNIKIIAMSGGGNIGPDSYLKAAELFGAAKTFQKPFNIDELKETVKELIGAP